MDGWLKGLIAVACVVVIAGGGYYTWSEYSAKKERTLINERRAASARCQSRMEAIMDGNLSADDQIVISNCIVQGHITEADLNRVSQARRPGG
ncbi:hypothetical protein CU102_12755 [Phyllobacterium brassicacearum]|uniref:Uncharacterized protein n=1 Tax=Phyllobacterium brassicacearum TaxID=314235 RepID=A0A2P7BQ71_9HYPH|nr:hypothetical protein [Phyllobacterium brassicacearum]PSH68623.1 hypothetical protein CU102_12755 [Phyllobacterium brassicacearum]TDQ24173.1 hypothetical protein DEV91_11551 [Phyllobacterium brassicacearum]